MNKCSSAVFKTRPLADARGKPLRKRHNSAYDTVNSASGACRALAMLWRYFELVELPRVCWRESQMLHRRSCVHTAPHSEQEAAELDGGKVPEISLAVCLKAQRGHADQPRPNSSAS
jgi:hypothetical protein